MIVISNLKPINLERRFYEAAPDTNGDEHSTFITYMANHQVDNSSTVRVVKNRKTPISTMVGGMSCSVYHKNLIDMLRVAYKHNLGVALTPEAIIFAINMEIQKINSYCAHTIENGKFTPEHYSKMFTAEEDNLCANSVVESRDMNSLSLIDFIGNGCDPFNNCITEYLGDNQYDFTVRNITHVKIMEGVPEKIISQLENIECKNEFVEVYVKKMLELMNLIMNNKDNKTFWQNMYYVCYDNNGPAEYGWIFDIIDSMRTVTKEFYDHVCSIEFVDSISGVRFQMLQGIFSSAVDADSTLVPLNNSKIIYQLSPKDV